MKTYLTNEQMRIADLETMKTVAPLELMERAGRAVADEAQQHGSSFLIVCGSGNNGGDGYVAARYLMERGYRVDICQVGQPKSAECVANASLYKGAYVDFTDSYDVIIDCLFGTGLARNVEGKYKEIIQAINRSSSFVLSVDAPSGLNGTSGQVMGTCVKADLVLAIAYEKVGFILGDGIDVCNKIKVADIGIYSKEGNFVLEEEELSKFFPKQKRNVHKGTFGKATLIAGSMKYSGAAMLALSSLLKMGTGYTELCLEKEVLPYFIGKYPEAILTSREAFKADAKAIGIGSGCGVSRELYDLIVGALKCQSTLVIDADGLNSLSMYGLECLKEKTAKVIITPHIGEFVRLSKKSKEEILSDPIGYAKDFAKEYGVVVLLKNAVSVITDGESVYLNVTGTPALAKGGSGDVLCGIVTGLATRLSPLESAFVGAYLLGKAGEESAKKNGEYSSQASDVVKELPSLLRRYTEQA